MGLRGRRGFTLIELLVVISIIGILASLIIVSVSGAQKKARDTKTKNNARSIATALSQYQLDQGKFFVDSTNAATVINVPANNLATALVPLYIKSSAVFSSNLTAKYLANGDGTSYAQAWLMESNGENAITTGLGVYQTYGEAYPGTVLAPTTTSSAIKFNSANSNNVLIPDVAGAFTNLANFSAAFWVKRDAATNDERMLSKSAFILGYELGSWSVHSGLATNNQLICSMRIGSAWPTATSGVDTFPLGQWNHVGCVYDGVRVRLYINGVEVANNGSDLSGNLASYGGGSVAYPVAIGSRSQSPTWNYFSGYISDVRLYNNALNATDLLNLTNGQPELVTKVAPGVWRLAEVNGTTTPYSGTFIGNGTVNGAFSMAASSTSNPLRIEGIGSISTGKAYVTYGP